MYTEMYCSISFDHIGDEMSFCLWLQIICDFQESS